MKKWLVGLGLVLVLVIGYLAFILNAHISESEKFKFVSCTKPVDLDQIVVDGFSMEIGDCWRFEENKFSIFHGTNFVLYAFELPGYRGVSLKETGVMTSDSFHHIGLNPVRRVYEKDQTFGLDIAMQELNSNKVNIVFDESMELKDKKRTDDTIFGLLNIKGFALGNLEEDRYDIKLTFDRSYDVDFYMIMKGGAMMIYLKRFNLSAPVSAEI